MTQVLLPRDVLICISLACSEPVGARSINNENARPGRALSILGKIKNDIAHRVASKGDDDELALGEDMGKESCLMGT